MALEFVNSDTVAPVGWSLGRALCKKMSGFSRVSARELRWACLSRNKLSMSIILVRKRYTGRAARFNWACKNADSVLFVRTGVASRAEVCDLLSRTYFKSQSPRHCFILTVFKDVQSYKISAFPGQEWQSASLVFPFLACIFVVAFVVASG